MEATVATSQGTEDRSNRRHATWKNGSGGFPDVRSKGRAAETLRKYRRNVAHQVKRVDKKGVQAGG